LAADDGEELVLKGEMWIDGATPTTEQPAEEGKLALLDLMTYRLDDGQLQEFLLREGDRVKVRGEARREIIGERASGYRDGGMTYVMRGAPGEPLLITLLS
jgi:hypothetical protein